MLHIVLLLLKILGIILLVILGLILLVLLLVLFVPVRYRMDGTASDKRKGYAAGDAVVSWLLHLFRAKVSYDCSLVVTVKVLFFTLFKETLIGGEKEVKAEGEKESGKKRKSGKKKSDDLEDDLDDILDDGLEEAGPDLVMQEISPPEVSEEESPMPESQEVESLPPTPEETFVGSVESAGPELMSEAAGVTADSAEGAMVEEAGVYRSGHTLTITGMKKKRKWGAQKAEKTPKSEKTPKPKKTKSKKSEKSEHSAEAEESKESKLAALVEKIQGICQTISEKWQKGQDTYDKATEFISDEGNQQLFSLVWRQIKKLIVHILPRKISGRFKFGFEDPYTTGQILTVVSPFYPLYAKTFSFEPVFNDKVLDGEVHIKGHIRVITLLWIVVRVLLNRNLWKLIRKWRKKIRRKRYG